MEGQGIAENTFNKLEKGFGKTVEDLKYPIIMNLSRQGYSPMSCKESDTTE